MIYKFEVTNLLVVEAPSFVEALEDLMHRDDGKVDEDSTIKPIK